MQRALVPLRALVIGSAFFPLVAFSFVCWDGYNNLSKQVDERLERTLDVVQEHGLRVFQGTERLLTRAGELVVRGAGSPSTELELHKGFAQIQAGHPEIEAIWAFGRSGHPIASSTIFPVPPDLNNADRDYFRAQLDADRGTYFSGNVRARLGNQSFFVASLRRQTTDGAFDGVLAVTIPPAPLNAFYSKLDRNTSLSIGLFRSDGVPLARWPEPPGGLVAARTSPSFVRQLAQSPIAGDYTVRSGVDDTSRRIAYRRIGDYPVYATAGFETAAFWSEYFRLISGYLIVGLPLACSFLLMSLLALRRTKLSIAESERRHRAEAALKHAQRLEAVGRLTGGVAHDFNNLLMVIQAAAERLRRRLSAEQQETAIRTLLSSVERGASLTRQLLSFSRRQVINPVTIQLQVDLPHLRDMLQTSLRGDITLEISAAQDLWPIRVDLAEFELALLNLAINARDAMPISGHLRISATNVPGAVASGTDCVEVRVSDTGHGIPADILPSIFDPFFTTKEVGRGTGLGLSQVYGFVTQAGGSVSVESVEGEGTVFTLRLPAHRAAPHDERSKACSAAVVGRPLSILVVEDNAEVATVTIDHLRRDNHTVEHAANAAEGLRLLESRPYDVLLTDVVMPGEMNGRALARVARDRWPLMAILLVTGYEREIEQSGADEYKVLRKPYSLDDLRGSLAEVTEAGSISGSPAEGGPFRAAAAIST